MAKTETEVETAPAIDAAVADRSPARLSEARRSARGAVIGPTPTTRANLIAGLQAAVAPFFVSRLIVWAATIFGARNIPATPGMYSNTYPPPALSPFFHWDTDAYWYIAHHGYSLGAGGTEAQALRVAWFPFYPLLVYCRAGASGR